MNLREQLKAKNSESEETSRFISKLKSDLAAVTAESENLKEQIRTKSSMLQELEEQLKYRTLEVEESDRHASKLEADLSMTTRELAELRSAAEESESEQIRLERAVEHLRGRVDTDEAIRENTIRALEHGLSLLRQVD